MGGESGIDSAGGGGCATQTVCSMAGAGVWTALARSRTPAAVDPHAVVLGSATVTPMVKIEPQIVIIQVVYKTML